MTLAVSIRPVTSADLETLAAVHATSFSPAWTAAELAWMLEPPGLAFVAEGANQPAGFVLARAVGDEAEILALAVAPHSRRMGVGTRLLGALIEALTEHAVATIYLEVAADNAAALRLYAGAGFEESGRRRGYYGRAKGPAVDAIVMMKRLGGAP